MYKLKPGIQMAYALGLPIVIAEGLNKEKPKAREEPNNQNSLFMKASQIPIYEKPEDLNFYEYHGKEKGMLQDGISIARKELESVFEITNEAKESISNIYCTGKAHTLSSIEYLQNDENVAARIGAITTGGLLGLIFAIRRGIFKKLIYSSAGAGGAASVCYPKQAFELSQDVIYNAGDYAAIGYNFVVGVKPQSKDVISEVKQEAKESPIIPQHPRSIDSAVATKVSEEIPKADTSENDDKKQNEKSVKDVILKLEKSIKDSVEGDIGQSNLEDKDMYTTRG